MKKNVILLASILLVSSRLFSQIGINTQNPQGMFNIDGGKDNPLTGTNHTTTQQLNDFVVLPNGNTGIGTINPSQKLEIQTGGTTTAPVTGFKLADGTQHDKYVLTSNIDGTAVWKPVSVPAVQGSFPGLGVNIPFTNPNQRGIWQQTGANITLPPGKWKVDIILLLGCRGNTTIDSNTWMWLKSTFADSATSTTPAYSDFTSTNILASASFPGPSSLTIDKNGILQGTIIINNSLGINKTYYLLVGDRGVGGTETAGAYLANVGGNVWGENSIIAYPMSTF